MIVSEACLIPAPSRPTPPPWRAAEQRSSSEWHSGFRQEKQQHGGSWGQSRFSFVEAGNQFLSGRGELQGNWLNGRDMEETAGASAYGASLAGRGFDFQKFVRQPQTIVRLLSWVSVCEGFRVQRFKSGRDNVHCDLWAGASGPEPVNCLYGANKMKYFYLCWPEQQATVCCMQLVHDSSSTTAQVNTAVVRGQKRQKTVRATDRAISGRNRPTTRAVIVLMCDL